MRTHAVVIGSGHNGLVAAGYLARAGLDVIVFERREIMGGSTATEEVLPGFNASSCAFVLGLFRPEIIDDLELKRYGLDLFASPDALATTIAEDGQRFSMWRDLDRTLKELEGQFGRREVEAFLQFGRTMQRIGELLGCFLIGNAPCVDDIREALDDAGLDEAYDRFFAGSSADLLDHYFDSDLLKGFLGYSSIVSVFGGPQAPWTAYNLTHHSVGDFEGSFGQWGFVRGGMGGLIQALAASAQAAGARIVTGAEVTSISLWDGRATGVILANGDEINSDIVVSTAEPTRTLLGMVGESDLPSELVSALRGYDVRGTMARVFVAVDRLPQFLGTSGESPGPQHRGHIFLGPSMKRYETASQAEKLGVLPDDFTIEARIESVLDPELVPTGKHMIVTGVQQLPLRLAGMSWDKARDDLMSRVVKKLLHYAPNLDGHIIGTSAITPLDLERTYGLTGGNIYHGAQNLGQFAANRPVPALSDYRTPIEGLYLGGAGTHPGGGVMGAPGLNAALAVLCDRGLRVPREAQQAGSKGRRGMGDLVLDSAALRRIALAGAKQPWLRGLTKRATQKR